MPDFNVGLSQGSICKITALVNYTVKILHLELQTLCTISWNKEASTFEISDHRFSL